MAAFDRDLCVVEYVEAEQIEAGAVVHGAPDQFGAMQLYFHLAIEPLLQGLFQRGEEGSPSRSRYSTVQNQRSVHITEVV